MYKIFFAALLWLALAGGAYSQIPLPTGFTQTNDPDIKGLNWYKGSSGKFTVLSIDKENAKYVLDNIDNMRKWTLTRWGLPDIAFSAECRIMCVPNKALMKKLFGLEKSAGEVRRDVSGKITMTILWLVLDGNPAESIPAPLTLVSLKELELQKNAKFNWWVHRGMTMLNQTVPQIKEEFSFMSGRIEKNLEIFGADALLNLTEEDWLQLSKDKQDLFDQQAAMVCLLFRKELGQNNLMRFIRTGSSEENLKRVYGFKGYGEFESTMKRYMLHLSNDINKDKTPVSYLQIFPVK